MSQKTLKIDPNLFSLSGKKKEKKIKTRNNISSKEENNSNKLKKEMLKRVKDYQKNKEQEKIKEEKLNSNIDSDLEENDFEREFNKSLNFLGNLAKKNKDKKMKTQKRNDLEINLNLGNDLKRKEPNYGCLKNGNKPTFRDLNKTQKADSKQRIKIILENNTIEGENTANTANTNNNANTANTDNNANTANTDNNANTANNANSTNDNLVINIDTANNSVNTNNNNFDNNKENNSRENSENIIEDNFETKNEESIIDKNSNEFIDLLNKKENLINNIENINLENEIKNNISIEEDSYNNKIEKIDNIPKLRRIKRKKTYKLGKNKNKNCVGILIKNRDTQKNIKQEITNLKKKSILDIKNYLRQKNLIKIGSDAPNDVLRKLYEDSILSGNINNTNNNNLVFNYLNE